MPLSSFPCRFLSRKAFKRKFLTTTVEFPVWLLERTYVSNPAEFALSGSLFYGLPDRRDVDPAPFRILDRLSRILESVESGKADDDDILDARKCLTGICDAYGDNEKMSILWDGMRKFYNTVLNAYVRGRMADAARLDSIREECFARLEDWRIRNITTFDRVAAEFGIPFYYPDIRGGLPGDPPLNGPADAQDADIFRSFIRDLVQEQGSPATGDVPFDPFSQYVDGEYKKDMQIVEQAHEVGAPIVPGDEMARTMMNNDPQLKAYCDQEFGDYTDWAKVSGNPFAEAAAKYQIGPYCNIRPDGTDDNYMGGAANDVPENGSWWDGLAKWFDGVGKWVAGGLAALLMSAGIGYSVYNASDSPDHSYDHDGHGPDGLQTLGPDSPIGSVGKVTGEPRNAVGISSSESNGGFEIEVCNGGWHLDPDYVAVVTFGTPRAYELCNRSGNGDEVSYYHGYGAYNNLGQLQRHVFYAKYAEIEAKKLADADMNGTTDLYGHPADYYEAVGYVFISGG